MSQKLVQTQANVQVQQLSALQVAVSKMVELPDGKKRKKLVKYMYDLGSCTFCQLCVTSCASHAIEFSNDFEQAVFTRDKLVKQLNYLPEKEEPAPAPKPATQPTTETK